MRIKNGRDEEEGGCVTPASYTGALFHILCMMYLHSIIKSVISHGGRSGMSRSDKIRSRNHRDRVQKTIRHLGNQTHWSGT
jgi:hypothetical protein